jgi:NAD(P)-dependent dehydrogenase (short-subunit alcohol dehydrogenase family)
MADTTEVPDYARMARVDDRGFIVAGGGQGMGRQVAHALAQHGGRVLVFDIVAERAEAVAKEIDGIAFSGDGRIPEDVERAVHTARSEFGRLHGVVDVIGMARWAALVDMPDEDWDWCHGMVVRHAYNFLKHASGPIAEGGGGSFAFVSSISGISSSPYHGAYGVAKAELISLVRTAATELASDEVRVNAVAPGGVATPRAARSRGMPAEMLADGTLGASAATSDIASALFFFSTDLSSHVTGQTIAVDGGDLVAYPHPISGPILPPGRAMGEDELDGAES